LTLHILLSISLFIMYMLYVMWLRRRWSVATIKGEQCSLSIVCEHCDWFSCSEQSHCSTTAHSTLHSGRHSMYGKLYFSFFVVICLTVTVPREIQGRLYGMVLRKV